MNNVAITGAGGYLGRLLLERLNREEEVELIAGIDLKAPCSNPPHFKFFKRDVRQPFTDIFVGNSIDTAFHLAFSVTPVHDEKGSHETNIEGANNFLKACEQAGVRQIIYISSYVVYGAHKDNPALIDEGAKLCPNPGFLYPNDKARVDAIFQEYMEAHPDVCVTIIRAATVTGPKMASGGLDQLFTPVMVRPAGCDPLWQFIHEEDLAELAMVLVKGRHRGVFNAAADGGLRYTQIIDALRKPCLTLPGGMLAWLTRVSWKLRLQSRSPGGVELLMHPVTVNTEKLKKATGFQCQYTGQQAFMSFINSRKSI